MRPDWLLWVSEIRSISQAGLTYSTNPFDIDRYHKLLKLSAEIASCYTDANLEKVVDLFEHEQGYATPKIDVRAVIIEDGKVLLVQEKNDGYRWTLPGGWADVNESPSEGVIREVQEEAGYICRVTKLLAFYDRSRHGHPYEIFYTYKAFFRCEITGKSQQQELETGEVKFFAEDDLPELSINRVTASEIHRFFEHSRHPEWQTDFD